MKIILVRHCETEWNKEERCQGISDTELNSTGFKQAELLKEYFLNQKIDFVFSSNLKRAQQTLDKINFDNRFKVNYSEDLREMNQGDFEGLSLSHLRKEYSEELKIWRENPEEFRLPNGETLGEVQERIWLFMKNLVNNYSMSSKVLVVTHNLVIACLLCMIEGKRLKFFSNYTTDSGAISIVSFKDNIFSGELINFTEHLK